MHHAVTVASAGRTVPPYDTSTVCKGPWQTPVVSVDHCTCTTVSWFGCWLPACRPVPEHTTICLIRPPWPWIHLYLASLPKLRSVLLQQPTPALVTASNDPIPPKPNPRLHHHHPTQMAATSPSTSPPSNPTGQSSGYLVMRKTVVQRGGCMSASPGAHATAAPQHAAARSLGVGRFTCSIALAATAAVAPLPRPLQAASISA